MAATHLIHGFIGSGKTTFAKALEASEPRCIRFTHDEWVHQLYGTTPPEQEFPEIFNRIDTLIWDTALSVLRNDCSVILDHGFWTESSRRNARQRLETDGHRVQFYSVQCDLATMKKRTLARSEAPPADSLWIDRKAFDTLYGQFEPMTDHELRIEIDGSIDRVL